MRAAMCVIVRDLIVYGVLTDMMRGRPPSTRRSRATTRSPTTRGSSADTLEALRKLDEQFGRIDRARRYAARPTSSSCSRITVRRRERRSSSGTATGSTTLSSARSRTVNGGDRRRRRAARDGRARHRRGDGTNREESARRRTSPIGAVVLGSGNLGLISLLEEPRRLTLEEIDERHPEASAHSPRASAHRLAARSLLRARPGRPRRQRRTTSRRARSRETTRWRRSRRPRRATSGARTASPRRRHHGRQLLRAQPGGRLRVRELISFHGGSAGPRRSRSCSTRWSCPCPTSRSSARSRSTACSPAGAESLQATAPTRSPPDEPRLGRSHHRRDDGRSGHGDAAGAAGARGQPLSRRRPRVRVFGVLATGFSVLLGFIVFLAFESYDQSRSGAEARRSCSPSRSRRRRASASPLPFPSPGS